jgi:hypothetical protein
MPNCARSSTRCGASGTDGLLVARRETSGWGDDNNAGAAKPRPLLVFRYFGASPLSVIHALIPTCHVGLPRGHPFRMLYPPQPPPQPPTGGG